MPAQANTVASSLATPGSAFSTVFMIICGVVAVIVLIYRFLKKPHVHPVSLASPPSTWTPFQLLAKRDVNYNTIAFRFALPSAAHRLGFPIGKHILLQGKAADEKTFSRPYTPVTSDEQLGWFELVIKIYPTGQMGQYLKNLALGRNVHMRGPLGALSYNGNGSFDVRRASTVKSYQIRKIGMLAGGTGLTPMLQIVREIASHPRDTTQISFLFANQTEEDILLKHELDAYNESHSNIKIHYSVDRPRDDWKGARGFMTADTIRSRMPPPGADTLILVCGPPPMCKKMDEYLHGLNYTEDMIFIY